MSGASRDCFQSSPCCFRLVDTALVPARASCQVRNKLYGRQARTAGAKREEDIPEVLKLTLLAAGSGLVFFFGGIVEVLELRSELSTARFTPGKCDAQQSSSSRQCSKERWQALRVA